MSLEACGARKSLSIELGWNLVLAFTISRERDSRNGLMKHGTLSVLFGATRICIDSNQQIQSV